MRRPAAQSRHAKDVQGYIDGVLSGKIAAGRLVIAAVKRHQRDLKRSAGEKWKYHFDQSAGDHVINFIECLKHSTGEFAGKPFLLLPWQKFLISVLFGWIVTATGFRRFREAYISVGRGNGKSPLAASLLLYLLCADRPPEPRAEIKIAATERGKKADNGGAMIVFNECCRFISASPALAKACKVTNNAIIYTKNEGTITPLGKEAKTKDGFNLHAFVADELHEWHAEHQGVWDKLQTAMGKRRQPLAISITTAGSDRSVLWKRQFLAAKKVVTGVYEDDQLFVFAATMDIAEDDLPGDDVFAKNAPEKVWPKANPNLGISVKPDYLQRLTVKAEHDADELNNLLRYHMNVMVRSRLKLINMDRWKLSTAQTLPDLNRLVCHGGIDLGWRDDLAAFYLCFPLPERVFAVMGWNWVCEETPHRDLNREPWASLIDSGKLIVTPGEVFDPDAILEKVKWVTKRFRLQTVAIDPNNARMMEVELVNKYGVQVYNFPQNCKKYNEPLKALLEAINERRLITGDDPLLTIQASNLCVKKDVMNLMMPDKRYSDEKIDGMCAMTMALSECLYSGAPKTLGYNERGLRRLGRGTEQTA